MDIIKLVHSHNPSASFTKSNNLRTPLHTAGLSQLSLILTSSHCEIMYYVIQICLEPNSIRRFVRNLSNPLFTYRIYFAERDQMNKKFSALI